MALFVLYCLSESQRFHRIHRTRELRGRNDQGEFGVLLFFSRQCSVLYVIYFVNVPVNSQPPEHSVCAGVGDSEW